MSQYLSALCIKAKVSRLLRNLPFVGDDVSISLLEGQFDRILWIIQIVQKQCLLPNHYTDLCYVKAKWLQLFKITHPANHQIWQH